MADWGYNTSKHVQTEDSYIRDMLDSIKRQATEIKTKEFVVDLPDAEAAQICQVRWQHTAALLNINYRQSIVPFGEEKCHLTVVLTGMGEDVEYMMNFINQSLEFLNNDGNKYET